ncbi:hypothetical protein CONCODRAFT_19249 [Conidiobolus coronatus NRRL 28638]|uniref:Uncharacterized protein n=1 Tax=Conidiobolus coronatus (strain ATCC 28846 / CBS 209.66 / NRRL 28638) TaxID=796925 RepID=A0A137NZQ6_CONC2|nr:hypothetical protein CONCODRAFT_19249 [Conidiobolus coronatus NRRL 28638]|eukprot:KXN68069.1 hypothetical protein CONCODRAFT_19249 [Conidiobolus coronatus NRRL 28638]
MPKVYFLELENESIVTKCKGYSGKLSKAQYLDLLGGKSLELQVTKWFRSLKKSTIQIQRTTPYNLNFLFNKRQQVLENGIWTNTGQLVVRNPVGLIGRGQPSEPHGLPYAVEVFDFFGVSCVDKYLVAFSPALKHQSQLAPSPTALLFQDPHYLLSFESIIEEVFQLYCYYIKGCDESFIKAETAWIFRYIVPYKRAKSSASEGLELEPKHKFLLKKLPSILASTKPKSTPSIKRPVKQNAHQLSKVNGVDAFINALNDHLIPYASKWMFQKLRTDGEEVVLKQIEEKFYRKANMAPFRPPNDPTAVPKILALTCGRDIRDSPNVAVFANSSSQISNTLSFGDLRNDQSKQDLYNFISKCNPDAAVISGLHYCTNRFYNDVSKIILESYKQVRKNCTLSMICDEIQNPYYDHRSPYLPASPHELFAQLTGESPTGLVRVPLLPFFPYLVIPATFPF